MTIWLIVILDNYFKLCEVKSQKRTKNKCRTNWTVFMCTNTNYVNVGTHNTITT